MSGGSMNYFSFTFDAPLSIISKEIKWGKNKWTPETLLEFQNAVNYLKLAQIYSHRVEWLLSCDDGEDSFIKRLKEELEENSKNPEVIEPRLKKCSLCENFNSKACKYRFDLSYRYADNPEWEEIDRKNYEKRLTDASDCWNFEEREDEGENP